MAINTATVAQTETAVSNSATREGNFQRGMDNIINQVDRSINSITVVGAVQGSVTLAAGTTDNAVQLVVTPTNAGGTYVDANGVTQTVPGLTRADIDPNALRRFRVLDTDGTTVLFEIDGFIPPTTP